MKSFKIENSNLNAFEITDLVIKKTGILNNLKSDGVPENISKIENIEELLNGIKTFTEEQNDLLNKSNKLSEFLEDVALATDFDNDKKNTSNRVSLMTIHLAKGLEFPEIYIVGVEEDLFPSAMSLNTRLELEEERRLFYVALTRAKIRVSITYTKSRYRWGKLIDCDKSRFIDEIDSKYLNLSLPIESSNINSFIDKSIFGSYDKNKSEFNSVTKLNKDKLNKLKKLKYVNSYKNLDDNKIRLEIGSNVSHGRFGKGKVVMIEGVGKDKKASIMFEYIGVKTLLLRFAKLNLVDE